MTDTQKLSKNKAIDETANEAVADKGPGSDRSGDVSDRPGTASGRSGAVAVKSGAEADGLGQDQSSSLEDQLDGIYFIGNTLGPLFYYDPNDEFVQASYEAFGTLDPEQASKEWPYVSPDAAKPALDLMTRGASGGVDDDMVWEYRRLFVGPNAKATPPWGSVYTDRECVVFGEATLALRQWMKRTGVVRLNSEKEPEDHIGLMLMMLSWIQLNRPDLTEEYLRDHLLPWASHFLEEMEKAAEHPFYEGLARLTRLSLEGIQAECGIEVDYPRFYR